MVLKINKLHKIMIKNHKKWSKTGPSKTPPKMALFLHNSKTLKIQFFLRKKSKKWKNLKKSQKNHKKHEKTQKTQKTPKMASLGTPPSFDPHPPWERFLAIFRLFSLFYQKNVLFIIKVPKTLTTPIFPYFRYINSPLSKINKFFY